MLLVLLVLLLLDVLLVLLVLLLPGRRPKSRCTSGMRRRTRTAELGSAPRDQPTVARQRSFSFVRVMHWGKEVG